MKIISYNIHHCSQAKVDKLLSMEADVYVVPELSGNDEIVLPPQYSMFWVGNTLNKKKGLGIIYNIECNCKIADWYNSNHEYVIPLLCNDILILAMWPTKTELNKKKSYPQIAIEALTEYSKYFNGSKVIICGDFNCYHGQSGEIASKYSINVIFDFLKQFNIHSLYHTVTNERLGQESIPTFYFRFKKQSSFFIDYAFANFKVVKFEIAKWDKTMSDHSALIIQF